MAKRMAKTRGPTMIVGKLGNVRDRLDSGARGGRQRPCVRPVRRAGPRRTVDLVASAPHSRRKREKAGRHSSAEVVPVVVEVEVAVPRSIPAGW